MSHEALAKWNYHVSVGDILLLASRGLESKAIQIYQSNMRGGAATRYTHVAVVISPDMVVDAMPKVGVGLTRWADMEADYDIENCRVARNVHLVGNTDVARRLFERATYYYKQPYKLSTLLSAPAAYTDQAGLVCSQFVALLLSDVGVTVSVRPVLETLPIDIDSGTQTLPDWRQFPLAEYGLHSKCATPDRAYTADLLRAFPVQLSVEQAEEAKRIAEGLSDQKGLDEFLQRTDAQLEKANELRRQWNDLLPSLMEHQYEISRQISELDDVALGLLHLIHEKDSRGEDLSTLKGELLKALPSSEKPFSGASLLSIWNSLFISYKRSNPIFVHEQRSATNHIERCAFFRRQLEFAQRIADSTSKQFEQLSTYLETLLLLAQRGAVDVDLVRSVRKFAEDLIGNGKLFSSESPEEVRNRIDSFGLVVEQLTSWLKSSDFDRKFKEEAVECRLAIQKLDVERHIWVTSTQPGLTGIVEKLRSIEEGLEGPRER